MRKENISGKSIKKINLQPPWWKFFSSPAFPEKEHFFCLGWITFFDHQIKQYALNRDWKISFLLIGVAGVTPVIQDFNSWVLWKYQPYLVFSLHFFAIFGNCCILSIWHFSIQRCYIQSCESKRKLQGLSFFRIKDWYTFLTKLKLCRFFYVGLIFNDSHFFKKLISI